VPSQVEIQCECAFTYMNAASGKDLTGRVLVDEVDADVTHDTGGALRDVTNEARFCRTTATGIWGVSDPRFFKRRTSTGGWQRGSLTPQMPPSLLRTTAPTSTRAANSAARLTVVKLLIAKNIATFAHRRNHVPLAAR
jgi:hypothetical protein